MDLSTLSSLVVILAIAVLSPLLADLLKSRIFVPTVVPELVLGIIVGPTLLGWVIDDAAISGLSNLGLAVLMFLAGYEIDFQRIRGAPITLATRSWLVSLVLGFLIAAAAAALTGGLQPHAIAIGMVITTTAMGTLLPILRDRGSWGRRSGPMCSPRGPSASSVRSSGSRSFSQPTARCTVPSSC